MRYVLASALAGAVMAAAGSAAQTPPPQEPKAQVPAAQGTQESQMATVEGCLMREADVPGRKPNVVERAGVAEDYILTAAKVVKGAAPSGVGARGMFEIEGISEDQLKQHVGKRVQIVGSFQNVDRAQATPERATPADDLPEVRGTTIRAVSGECPAKY
jgi:hypothetical protein